MPLNELLRDLVNGCGALSALVMTADGFPLEEFRSPDPFDLDGCSVAFATILKDTLKLAQSLRSGSLEELTLQTEKLRFIVRSLSGGAALLLLLPVDGACGKARYLLSRDLPKFSEALKSA